MTTTIERIRPVREVWRVRHPYLTRPDEFYETHADARRRLDGLGATLKPQSIERVSVCEIVA